MEQQLSITDPLGPVAVIDPRIFSDDINPINQYVLAHLWLKRGGIFPLGLVNELYKKAGVGEKSRRALMDELKQQGWVKSHQSDRANGRFSGYVIELVRPGFDSGHQAAILPHGRNDHPAETTARQNCRPVEPAQTQAYKAPSRVGAYTHAEISSGCNLLQSHNLQGEEIEERDKSGALERETAPPRGPEAVRVNEQQLAAKRRDMDLQARALAIAERSGRPADEIYAELKALAEKADRRTPPRSAAPSPAAAHNLERAGRLAEIEARAAKLAAGTDPAVAEKRRAEAAAAQAAIEQAKRLSADAAKRETITVPVGTPPAERPRPNAPAQNENQAAALPPDIMTRGIGELLMELYVTSVRNRDTIGRQNDLNKWLPRLTGTLSQFEQAAGGPVAELRQKLLKAFEYSRKKGGQCLAFVETNLCLQGLQLPWADRLPFAKVGARYAAA